MSDQTWKIPPADGQDATPNDAGPSGTLRIEQPAAPAQPADATWRIETSSTGLLPLGVLAAGVKLCGEYEVLQTIQPHERMLPGLYMCQDSAGTKCMIKVAAVQFPPRSDIWTRLASFNHPNVLHTYRTIEQDGRYYEVQEYCDGGCLDDYRPRPGDTAARISPTVVMDQLVNHIHAGLRYLHEHGIVHRDIKPKNIYLRRSSGGMVAVLGDFDIASTLETDRTSRTTERAGGTWIYAAPESFPRFIDETGRVGAQVTFASDYYSLGISLIELLVGTTSLHACKLSDLYDFYLQGNHVAIPAGIPDRLATLLRGLLIRNGKTRWGAAEIDRWLANQNTADDLQRIQADESFTLGRATRPYKLEDVVAYDLPGLARAMCMKPETALDDLMSGDILLQWIGEQDSNIAREIRKAREKRWATPGQFLSFAIWTCDPHAPYIMRDGTEVHTLAEWLHEAIKLMSGRKYTEVQLCSEDDLSRLAVWLRAKADAEPQNADALEVIVTHPYPGSRLEEIAYIVQPDRPYYIMKGLAARTPQEIARLTYGNPDDWRNAPPDYYRASYQRWQDGALYAWMRQRGLQKMITQCEQITAKLKDEPVATFETILRLLDPQLPPVEVKVDASAVCPTLSIYLSNERRYLLPYTATGCGTPFGQLRFRWDAPGLHLEDAMINRRKGTVVLVENVEPGVDITDADSARLFLDSAFTKMDPPDIRFTLQFMQVSGLMLRYLLLGALIGLLVFLFPRAVYEMMMPYGYTSTITALLSGQSVPIDTNLWVPSITFLILLLVCIVIGGYIFNHTAIGCRPLFGSRPVRLSSLAAPFVRRDPDNTLRASNMGNGCIAFIVAAPFLLCTLIPYALMLGAFGLFAVAGLDSLFRGYSLFTGIPDPLLWAAWGALIGASLGLSNIAACCGIGRWRPWLIALPFVILLFSFIAGLIIGTL